MITTKNKETQHQFNKWVSGLSSRTQEAITYIAALVGTGFVTAAILHLDRVDWAKPFAYLADAVFGNALIKNVLVSGWYENSDLLNAPHGQVMHDYKIADNLLFVFARAGALFTDNSSLLMNLYFISGFVLAAITSVWFFRLIGIGRVYSVSLSILYAVTPYHFARGEYHLILSAYWPIPLAMGLVYLVARGKSIWILRNTESRFIYWGAGSALMTVFTLLIVGSSNSYYAFFTLLFVAVFGLISFISLKSFRHLLGAVFASVLLVVIMLVNMLPDILYSQQMGQNYTAVQRTPYGVEYYALRFTELLLPVPGHRLNWFAEARSFYMTEFQIGGEQPVLGFWAAAGFFGLIIGALLWLIKRKSEQTSSDSEVRTRTLISLTLFGFLLGTVGGLSSIIGFFTSDLRGWNRISIILALFGLAAVGVTAMWIGQTKFISKLRSTKLRITSLLVSAVLLTATGVFDQVTPQSAPDSAAAAAEFDADQLFVSQIEQTVGKYASIVQLPYRAFPESAGLVPDTEQLKPYLHSSTLKWTAGGIKGRPTSEWVSWLEQLDPESIVVSSRAAGFAGILVNRSDYEDHGEKIVSDLKTLLGEPSLTSSSGRMVFFSLENSKVNILMEAKSIEEQKKIADLVVNPISATFLPEVTSRFQGTDALKKYQPQILIDNPRSTVGLVHVSLNMTNALGTTQLNLKLPDGTQLLWNTSSKEQTFSFDMVAPPGRTYLNLEYVHGALLPKRTSWVPALKVTDISTVDPVLLELLNK